MSIKWIKYAYIFLISILLLTPAFCLWLMRTLLQVVVNFTIDWPLRKLVFILMWVHEWLLSKAGFGSKNPLKTIRIPRV